MRFFFLITVTLLLFLSCATTVPINVVRPAELDLQGAKSVSVLPIGLSQEGNAEGLNVSEVLLARIFGVLELPNKDEQAIARRITSGISRGLLDAQFMRVVPSDQVTGYLQNPSGTPPVDVYFTGQILRFYNEIESELVERESKGVTREVFEYRRVVEVDLTYQIIDARTRAIIAYKDKNFERTSFPKLDPDDLDSPLEVLESEIEQFIKQVLRELQPYEETRYLRLEKDDTKDPAMEVADSLVKDGFIQRAYDQYIKIYETTGNFAAGYNAALLVQALGDLEEARRQMSALADATLDSRALRALSDIEREIESSKRLQEQTAK
jgi:hypothetical protein